MRILLVDASTGAMTLVDQSDRASSYDNTNYSAVFSPDGKWLAFHRTEPNQNRAVYLYEIAGRKKFALTSPVPQRLPAELGSRGEIPLFSGGPPVRSLGNEPDPLLHLRPDGENPFVVLSAEGRSPFLPGNDEEGEPDKKTAAKPESRPRSPTCPP